MTVLAIDPAKPPQNNCFMASLERDGTAVVAVDVVAVVVVVGDWDSVPPSEMGTVSMALVISVILVLLVLLLLVAVVVLLSPLLLLLLLLLRCSGSVRRLIPTIPVV